MVKKILAIDGGGMYGVVPLEVCLRIEQKMGKPLREIFDLFVGTSTGSLIAASALSGLNHESGTTTFGFSAQQIIKAYEDYGQTIFSAKRENISLPGVNLDLYPKYDPRGLRSTLNKLIGERKLGRLNDRGQRISVSAYNMSKGKPYFFRSWADRDVYLRDVVMASSSAPTTHPMHKVGNDLYTDGGVFAVNPAPYALADGLKLWRNESLILVSLGTGKSEPSLEPPDSPDENLFWWLKNLSKVFTDGQNESVHEAMVQIDRSATWLKYFRFDINLNQKKKADELDFNVLNKARRLMGQAIDGVQQNEFQRLIQALQ